MNKFMLRNRIQDYIENELSLEERREMEEALPKHPEIIEEIEGWSQYRSKMLSMNQGLLPPERMEQILTEIEFTPPPRANNHQHYRWLPLILTGFALGLFWFMLPKQVVSQIDAESTQTLKGASVLPNRVQLPSTTPILEAEKQTLLPKVEPLLEKDSLVEKEKSLPKNDEKMTKKSPTSSNPTFVIKTPDTPYIPEWEAEGQIIQVGTEKLDPKAFQFPMASEDIIYQIALFSKSVNGHLRTEKGDEFLTKKLSSFEPRQHFELHVPTDKVSTTASYLTEIGGQFFAETIREKNGYAIFIIDVKYQYY